MTRALRLAALLPLAALVGAAPDKVQHATFAPGTADLPNPERGFYTPAPMDLTVLDAGFVRDAEAKGYRLIYARIDLSAYRGRALPAAFLGQLRRGFDTARGGAAKLIVRATYNYPRGETGYQSAQDAPLAIVQTHLRQLAPVLAANKDVIAFVQAGFIGAWGEWHTSSNRLDTADNKRAVRDALLAAVPGDRFVQFRYPPDFAAWQREADWARRLAPRIGFHNDCFLASQTDVGTFPDDRAEGDALRGLVAKLGDDAPFGGETCNPADDPGAVPRTTCRDILAEGARYNLVYLNDSYYRRLFHDRWRAQGCLDEVRRRMGYRIELRAATVPSRVARGRPLVVDLTLANTGWARPFLPRALELLLIHSGSGEIVRLPVANVDWRTWRPGVTQRIAARASVAPQLAPGTHRLALALPDPARPTDAGRAVRWANDDAGRARWDAALGAFDLGVGVIVE